MSEHYSYDVHGNHYSLLRRSDPHILAQLWKCVGMTDSVLNVGSGTGSYELPGRVTASLEPSATMRSQRPTVLPPAIRASAENIPFDDKSFDASLTILSLHHWPDKARGLSEMKRVSRKTIVILSYDPDALERFWLFRYLPELADIERRRFPTKSFVEEQLGVELQSTTVSVPLNCTDAFNEAFYGRPESLLDPQVRACQSAWALLGPTFEKRAVMQLEEEIRSGEWDLRYGAYRTQPFFEGAIRIWTADMT